MSETDPQMEIVPEHLFEIRGQGWRFQLSPNGAISYLSDDSHTGWQHLVPTAAIESSLSRGQLAEWKAGSDRTEMTLTWRYPRRPVVETMTIRLRATPAAMQIDRTLRNVAQEAVKVHEVRMLALDGGGIVLGHEPPENLRCIHVGDFRESGRGEAIPLPQLGRVFGDPEADSYPALAICDATRNMCVLEASLQQEPFTQMWQMRARPGWRKGQAVVSEYAAITRDRRRQPLTLAAGQQQRLSSLFYQVRTGCPETLHDDALTSLQAQSFLE